MSSQEVVDACNAGRYTIKDEDPVIPPGVVLDPSNLYTSAAAKVEGSWLRVWVLVAFGLLSVVYFSA